MSIILCTGGNVIVLYIRFSSTNLL